MSKPEPSPASQQVTPFWKHPYALYILLTAAIFGGMLLIIWIALESGILPKV